MSSIGPDCSLFFHLPPIFFRKAIKETVKEGDLVLDIGSGSGLLSIFAAESGARQVVGAEYNAPLATLAQQIIADNGLDKKIKIVPKMSHSLTVGPGCDLPERANVLVTCSLT